MAKERLSKLQKWIFKRCLEQSAKGMLRREIVNSYFQNRRSFLPSEKRKAEVTVTRSIWRLIESGYLEGLSPLPIELMAFLDGVTGQRNDEKFLNDYKDILKEPRKHQKIPIISIKGFSKVKIIRLTEKGKEKANELLNVK